MEKNKLFYIEDQNFITKEEDKNFIDNTLLGSSFPWYYNASQVEYDERPYLSHALLLRDQNEPNSMYFEWAKELTFNFCDKHNIPIKLFHRASINLCWPHEKYKGSSVHVDHNFPHKQLIIYLNKSTGDTFIHDKKGKKILKTFKYKQYKAICFDSEMHSMNYPKKGVRLSLIVTFS